MARLMKAEIERLRHKVEIYNQRMRVMWAYLERYGGSYRNFVFIYPEATDWFDEDGVPK
jgi:hypothetical protein